MIQAKVVAHSKRINTGEELVTLEVIMPRYILAEFNTHRVLSKNSASSRAIPFKKMVKSVQDNPFIPYAFQKDHKGMQGTVYLDINKEYSLSEFISVLITTLNTYDKDSKEFEDLSKEIDEKIEIIDSLLIDYKYQSRTLKDWWLLARDKAVECASIMYVFRVTKQLANRLLEPFMWHKVLVSGTEWENFFNLRCPQYEAPNGELYKSRKQMITDNQFNVESYKLSDHDVILDWLKINKGQADIHMMFLAEAIYDAINESTPKELKEGEWHIPYGDNIEIPKLMDYFDSKGLSHKTNEDYDEAIRKISIARCARLSYQTLGDNPEINYEKDLELFDTLSKSGHWSPFEHVAKVMNAEEYEDYYNGNLKTVSYTTDSNRKKQIENNKGWCRNFKGFIQSREYLDTNNR